MEISELIGLWPRVLELASRRELRKSDVVEALRSDEPIPPAARALLADILEGKHKNKRGPRGPSEFEQFVIVMRFLQLEEEFKATPKKIGETARTLALATVAREWRVSDSKIENVLTAKADYLKSARRVAASRHV